MNRLLCYAHFDENGQVQQYVRHSLATMSRICSAIVFISNSPLDDNDRQWLESHCINVIVNYNAGYDFFMWKKALESVNQVAYDEIVLMNSSVYGPISPIEPVFAEMIACNYDYWGITECFQRQPHLQSYFLVFTKKVIDSPAFAAFWQGVLPYCNKLQVIMSYETGLTLWLAESGFSMGVYRSFENLARYFAEQGKRLAKDDNVTLKHPQALLHSGSPFIKREVVRKKSLELQSIRPILDFNSYPVELFDEVRSITDINICPLCMKPGRLCHKRVRDYLNLHNTDRYNYYRCDNSLCGVLWQPTGKNAQVPEEDGRMNPEENLLECIMLEEQLVRAENIPLLLKDCWHRLKPGGILHLSAPNAEALSHILFRSYWSGLNAPRNSIIYTRKALRTLLSAAGFQVIDITTVAVSKKYTPQSLNIAINRWTTTDVPLGWGMELLTRVAGIICRLVNMVTGKHGDECRAVASKII